MNELLQSIKADLLSRHMLAMLAVAGVALIGALSYAVVGGSGGSKMPAPIPAAPLPSGLPVAVAPPNTTTAAAAETPAGVQYQTQGSTRDPFTPLAGSAPAGAPSKGGSGSSGGRGSGSSASSSAGGGKSNGRQSGPSVNASPPPTPSAPAPTPAAPVKSQSKHAGLTPKQSYGVSLSLTTFAGDLNAIDLLQRLSVLPSEQQPLLVYLGVLKGGHKALFVVQPGAVVSGPGTCIPGPTDCEILSLGQAQVESLAVRAGGGASGVALFAVTAIKVDEHSSVARALHARREASAAGRALLAASMLPALPLFEYRPDVGAVVDLRNLEAGDK